MTKKHLIIALWIISFALIVAGLIFKELVTSQIEAESLLEMEDRAVVLEAVATGDDESTDCSNLVSAIDHISQEAKSRTGVLVGAALVRRAVAAQCLEREVAQAQLETLYTAYQARLGEFDQRSPQLAWAYRVRGQDKWWSAAEQAPRFQLDRTAAESGARDE